MALRSIEDLVEALRGIPNAAFTRAKVLQEIGSAVLDPASIAPFLYFDPVRYTRNLVDRCDLFEVVVVGWERGQGSAIHNHRGQECWMGVPVGRLLVRNYRMRAQDTARGTCALEAAGIGTIDPEHPAAVDPEEPIHSVHNLVEYGCRAASVHVYSRPYDSCEIYLLEEGRYFDVPLTYTSVRGVLCDGATATRAAP